jgi:protein-disulfide isomerase
MHHRVFFSWLATHIAVAPNNYVYRGAAAGAAVIAVVVAYESATTLGNLTATHEKLSDPPPHMTPLGSFDVEMTIVEFGDYRCVHCAQFNVETKDSLISEYVDTGRMKFIFRDFPVNDTPANTSSSDAAEASYCAAEQGKYWEYHDGLFRNYDFEKNINVLTKNVLEKLASDAGVADLDRFSDCLVSGKYSSVVDENYNLAKSLGLKGTPAFLILSGDRELAMIEGYQTIDTVRKELDRISGYDST